MTHTQNADRVRRYVPCLEGIRGYGFLLVFCAHYFSPYQLAHPGTVRFKVLAALQSLAIFAVPAFFVLSGYLIGGILYDTRNREGYFRVFYSRRILRVFPVYYVTLLAIVSFYAIHGIVPNYHFWVHFLYIQNLFPSYALQHDGPVKIVHFWSLAVEEQFYLLWPVVTWCFPDRRKLIGIASMLIACSCGIRLAAPLISWSPEPLFHFTPTRVDAILLGVVLALIRHDVVFDRLKAFAKWVVLAGIVAAAILADWKGQVWSGTYCGVEVLIPLANVTAAAIVIAVMEENSLANRACSQRWACWLGSLSYSLYLFHLTFHDFFMNSLVARLCIYMRFSFAFLTSGALALALTIVLSILSYRFIEGPIINLKRHVKYGSAKPLATSQGVGERVLVSAGD
ncbi:MAG: acyltransferase [Terracidiphilus sp.]